jgi:coenzyme F420-0:L-glutamate ligase/coenzyme F420-1:gamma-L-glutamate ligase
VSGTDVSVIAVPGIPLVVAGDDVAALIGEALAALGRTLEPHDVVVVASTIISKAENRYVDLTGIEPSARAIELAAATEKDPRLVEVVLSESTAVSRAVPGVLIVRHRLGFVSANAGVDFSNATGSADVGILLPIDPDHSATVIRDRLASRFGVAPLAVVISDTHGRAFRRGNLNVAIGIAGIPPLLDARGSADLYGRVLEATSIPLADQVAAAAGLVTGEAAEGLPVVVVRGLRFDAADAPADDLNWPPALDLFA